MTETSPEGMWQVSVAVSTTEYGEQRTLGPWKTVYSGRSEAEARRVFCDTECAVDIEMPRRYREVKLFLNNNLRLHVWRR